MGPEKKSGVLIDPQPEKQCATGTLCNVLLKISFQFQPAKFEIFKTETDWRLKNCIICVKTKVAGQKQLIFPFLVSQHFFSPKLRHLSD